MRTPALTVMLAVTLTIDAVGHPAASPTAVHPTTTDVPTVQFCELVQHAKDYKGSEVRVRATLSYGFERSSLVSPECPSDPTHFVWAEFSSVAKERSKPEALKAFHEALESLSRQERNLAKGTQSEWEIELVMTGMMFPPNGQGYGHTGIYSHEFLIVSIEEVGKARLNVLSMDEAP